MVAAAVVGAAGLVVGLVVGDVVGLVVGDVVLVADDDEVRYVDGCVAGADEDDVAVTVGVAVGFGEAEVVGLGVAGRVALPASDWVAVAPPLPPPGLCDMSRTAATAPITTAAAAVTSQPHRRRPRDRGLRGGSGGMLAPPPVPRSSGPETGTRDVSGRA